MAVEIGYERVGSFGLSLKDFQNVENMRIEQEVLIERQWWKEHVFETVDSAIEGGLTKVPIEGEGYRLIWRIIKEEEPNLLLPAAINLLEEISYSWRIKCSNLGLEVDNTRLAVTSLYRDFALQAKLRENSYLATKGVSGHAAGAVIDFDPNGYYQGEERKSVKISSNDFNHLYIYSLLGVLHEFENSQRCHVIYELGVKSDDYGKYYQYDRCYHVCLKPNEKKD